MSERKGWSFVPKNPEDAKMYEAGEALAAIANAGFQKARIDAILPYAEQVMPREEIETLLASLPALAKEMEEQEKPEYGKFIYAMDTIVYTLQNAVEDSGKFDNEKVKRVMEKIDQRATNGAFMANLKKTDPYMAEKILLQIRGWDWESTGHLATYLGLSAERKAEEGPLKLN